MDERESCVLWLEDFSILCVLQVALESDDYRVLGLCLADVFFAHVFFPSFWVTGFHKHTV